MIFFDPKAIGKKLKEVAIDVIETPNESLVSRWFHMEGGADLFTWSDSRKTIIKQQLSFHGQVVEWNCLEGLKTGVTVETDVGEAEIKEDKSGAEVAEKLSETVRFDESPQSSSVDLAVDILNHLDVDQKFRTQLITNFKNPQSLKSVHLKEFMARFGTSIKNYQKSDPGFWSYLKERFQEFLGQIKKK